MKSDSDYEKKLTELLRGYKDLLLEVENLICECEVEDFLLNGPGGVDPEEQ